MASEQKKPIPPSLSKLFRFVFGDDNRVIFWLIALGGITTAGWVFFALVAGLFLADRPGSTIELIYGLVLAVFLGPLMSTGFWVLLIGIGGLTVRRRWAMTEMRQAMPKTVESKRNSFGFLFGDDYRVAIWLMVMGAVWAGRFILDVAPSFLADGHPPYYVWIGPPDRLPPVEDVVQDALIPMALYVMKNSFGTWLMGAGAVIALAQSGRLLLHRLSRQGQYENNWRH